jgi:hypothetical protein
MGQKRPDSSKARILSLLAGTEPVPAKASRETASGTVSESLHAAAKRQQTPGAVNTAPLGMTQLRDSEPSQVGKSVVW